MRSWRRLEELNLWPAVWASRSPILGPRLHCRNLILGRNFLACAIGCDFVFHQYTAFHVVLAARRATQVEVLLAPSLARNVHARATRPTLTVERATPAHAVALNVNIITNLRT